MDCIFYFMYLYIYIYMYVWYIFILWYKIIYSEVFRWPRNPASLSLKNTHAISGITFTFMDSIWRWGMVMMLISLNIWKIWLMKEIWLTSWYGKYPIVIGFKDHPRWLFGISSNTAGECWWICLCQMDSTLNPQVVVLAFEHLKNV